MLCRTFFCALVGAFLLILPLASAANAMVPEEQVEQMMISRGLPFVVRETHADLSGATLSLAQHTDTERRIGSSARSATRSLVRR